MAAAWLRGGVALLFLLALLPFAAHAHGTAECGASASHCGESAPCDDGHASDRGVPDHGDGCPEHDGHACKCPCHALHAAAADVRWSLAEPAPDAARHALADDRVAHAAPHPLDQPPKLPA